MSDTPRTDAIKIRCGFQAVPEPILKLTQELERENSYLRKDKNRLDWLDSVGCWMTIPGYTKNNVWCWGASREVIDLARKEAQP